jgi:hypothetical protein
MQISSFLIANTGLFKSDSKNILKILKHTNIVTEVLWNVQIYYTP